MIGIKLNYHHGTNIPKQRKERLLEPLKLKILSNQGQIAIRHTSMRRSESVLSREGPLWMLPDLIHRQVWL